MPVGVRHASRCTPRCNIPETEKIKLEWTHQEKKDNISRKLMDMVVTEEEKKGPAAQNKMVRQHRVG